VLFGEKKREDIEYCIYCCVLCLFDLFTLFYMVCKFIKVYALFISTNTLTLT
jgi:hypothetical protein